MVRAPDKAGATLTLSSAL